MLETDHAGFHEPGWKSLMDCQQPRTVQIFVSGWKRPLGVCSFMPLVSNYARRLEGIVAREEQLPPVFAAFVRGFRRPADNKMPVSSGRTTRGYCLRADVHSTGAVGLSP